jgi:multisubunit Na+/H+ antiporter MnhB subunit
MTEQSPRAHRGTRASSAARPREHWLAPEQEYPAFPRSLLLEVCLRIAFPTVLVMSVYLLFAGHFRAGGGFSAGLVAGLAFVLRYVAGGSASLGRFRTAPHAVIGVGLTVAVLTALVPALFGQRMLTSSVWKAHLPVLGEIEIVTSLFFDIGVFLVIVGVVLNLLRTLGEGIRVGRLESQLEDREPGERAA